MSSINNIIVNKTFDALGLNNFFKEHGFDLEEYAKEHKLHHRTRNSISTASMLLFCLMWGSGVHTLRELAALGKALDIVDFSDVALLKRLRKSKDFLSALVQDILRAQISTNMMRQGDDTFQIVCVDGSYVYSRLGTYPDGTYLLHYGCRLTLSGKGASVNTDFFEFTPVRGKGNGESLAREGCRFREEDIVVADRAYTSARGIKSVLDAKADFILRIGLSALTLSRTADGKKRVNLAELVAEMNLEENETGEIEVWMKMPNNTWQKVRICTLRKTEAEKEEAVENYKKEIKNKKKRKYKISQEALMLCGFISVVTSIDKERFTAEEILNIYKLRWQIELAFKRFKSIGKMENLPTSNPISDQVYFLSKMLVFLLVENEIKDLDITAENLQNKGIDETGIKKENADPKLDFFWRDFKLGYNTVKNKIFLMAKLNNEQKQILLLCFQRFDKREKNRKRLRALKDIGWKIYNKISA